MGRVLNSLPTASPTPLPNPMQTAVETLASRPEITQAAQDTGSLCLAGCKAASFILCVIMPPGVANTVSGGRMLAMYVPDAGEVERLGIAGIGAVVSCVLFWVVRYLFKKYDDSKTSQIQRLEKENDRLAGELNKGRRK